MFCTEMVLQRNVRRYLQFYAGSLQNFGLCVRVTQKYAHTQSQPPEINRDCISEKRVIIRPWIIYQSTASDEKQVKVSR